MSGNDVQDEAMLVWGVCLHYLPQSEVGMMEKVHRHHCWMPRKRWWTQSSHLGDKAFSSAVIPVHAPLSALFAPTIASVASLAHGQALDNLQVCDEGWVGCEEVPADLSPQQLQI